MPYNERLGLKPNYENDFKVKSNAQNQSSSQCGIQTNWQLANTPKRQPLKPVNGEYPTDTSQAAAVLESPTKLIDLNYDCLEHIFRGFCLVDLIGIGGTCTYLQSATCRYFQTKFRKRTVFIDCERFPNYSISSGAVHQKTNIGSDIEAFMFVFGAVLSKLAIVNMCPMLQVDPERLESDAKIQRLIEKYCRNHLREISFRNCGKLTMNHAQPLEEVVKVSFDHCVLGEKLANFDYMFPKLKRLDLIDCDVRGVRRSIEKEFPQLEYLNLNVPLGANSWSESSFTVANVKAAIDRNPNIKHLNLRYWNASAYDAKLLKYAADKLPQLKSLQLWHMRYTDFWSDGDIRFPSVQKLVLVNRMQKLGYLGRNLAALSFENLRKFSILDQFDTECTTFVARHKTIKELCIVPNGEHEWYPSDEDVFRIFTVLPNLERLLVNGRRMTTKGLIRLISKRSKLSAIKVHQYTFSAVVRKLFRWKCTQLAWNVVFGTGSESEMTVKRRT